MERSCRPETNSGDLVTTRVASPAGFVPEARVRSTRGERLKSAVGRELLSAAKEGTSPAGFEPALPA